MHSYHGNLASIAQEYHNTLGMSQYEAIYITICLNILQFYLFTFVTLADLKTCTVCFQYQHHIIIILYLHTKVVCRGV